jgi:hypothetical protein
MTGATLTCLSGAGASTTADLLSVLTPEQQVIVRADTEAWIKRLRLVRYGAPSMRERFTYRSDSLWWFTEIYLHRMRRLEAAVATILALETARARHDPAKIVVATSDLVIRDAAHVFGRTHGLAIETTGATVTRARHAAPNYLAGLTAAFSRMRPLAPVFLASHATVAAFVQTSFGRPPIAGHQRPRSFFGQVLDAIAARVGPGELHCVGIGPRRHVRGRRASAQAAATGSGPRATTPIERLAPQGALGGALEIWRTRPDLAQAIVAGEEIRAAGLYRRCDLWPILRRELEATALLQWPWAARAMDDAAAAITTIKPDVVVTYNEASAWGRAIVLEARRRGVPSVGVQHDLLGEHGVLYAHELDEMAPLGPDAGFPAPDRTIVFEPSAASRLHDVGHFPPARIVVSGHPKIDDLRAARHAPPSPGTRDDVRRALGVRGDRRLAVLIARQPDLGAMLPALVAAVAARPGVCLAIKTPSTDALDLGATLQAPTQVCVVPEDFDLAQVLAAADGLITRESAAAIDALSRGVPSLVIGAPDHLGPLVDAGIMLGAAGPDQVGPGLDALLFDETVRRRLTRVVAASSAGDSATGGARAADRAADTILAVARKA